MARSSRPSWFSKPENVWLLVACLLGFINLFLILLLWNVSGTARQIDSLSVSLTALQLFLGVVALGGFFLFRTAAVRAAEEEARAEAQRLVPPVARRMAIEFLNARTSDANSTSSTNDGINDMMQALDKDGEEDNHA